MSPKTIVTLIIVVVAAIFIITQFVIPAVTPNEGKTITKSDLVKAVDIDKLETAQFTYEGIVDHKGNFAGSGEYHVSYVATVTASFDMGKLGIDIDQANKTVTFELPEINISSPKIDTDSIDYMPSDPGVDMKEILELCKKDATDATKNDDQIKRTAATNAKTAIKAMTSPLLEEQGYSIQWKDSQKDSGDSDKASSNQNQATANKKGKTNEDK